MYMSYLTYTKNYCYRPQEDEDVDELDEDGVTFDNENEEDEEEKEEEEDIMMEED